MRALNYQSCERYPPASSVKSELLCLGLEHSIFVLVLAERSFGEFYHSMTNLNSPFWYFRNHFGADIDTSYLRFAPPFHQYYKHRSVLNLSTTISLAISNTMSSSKRILPVYFVLTPLPALVASHLSLRQIFLHSPLPCTFQLEPDLAAQISKRRTREQEEKVVRYHADCVTYQDLADLQEEPV